MARSTTAPDDEADAGRGDAPPSTSPLIGSPQPWAARMPRGVGADAEERRMTQRDDPA